MKRTFNDKLDDSFGKLNQTIRMKPDDQERLRERILLDCNTTVHKKPSNRKMWLSVTVAILLLVVSSPFYSTTMASLAAKILPLEIPVNNFSTDDSLQAEIITIIKQAGYEYSSVGSRPNPFTIEIVLMKGETSLSSMKKVLVPEIEQLLHEQGIDNYKLNITQFKGGAEIPSKYRESNTLMDNADAIISDAFTTYGYSELAQHATMGISSGPFSRTLEIDMPDHVKEAEAIKNLVIESIEKEDLNIKDVKLRYYNAEHRSQDNRWAYIASDIHGALAGKSIYNVTGISYKVKDGFTHVWIKTALSEHPDKQVLADIEAALQTYLATNKIKVSIKNDPYTIQLVNEDKSVLLEVSNDVSIEQ